MSHCECLHLNDCFRRIVLKKSGSAASEREPGNLDSTRAAILIHCYAARRGDNRIFRPISHSGVFQHNSPCADVHSESNEGPVNKPLAGAPVRAVWPDANRGPRFPGMCRLPAQSGLCLSASDDHSHRVSSTVEKAQHMETPWTSPNRCAALDGTRRWPTQSLAALACGPP
jgi:hypothetical protein